MPERPQNHPNEEHHVLASEIKEKCWDPDWETFDAVLCAKILARNEQKIRRETLAEFLSRVDATSLTGAIKNEMAYLAKQQVGEITLLPSNSAPDATRTR